MVKYLAMMAVVVGSLVAVDSASAFGHKRGCSTCGGCPGGVCAVPYAAPVKTAAVVAPAGPVVAVATPVAPVPTYYTTSARRGLFGRR
jgi:hypothetical protein